MSTQKIKEAILKYMKEGLNEWEFKGEKRGVYTWINSTTDDIISIDFKTEYGKAKGSKLRDPSKSKWTILVRLNGEEIIFKSVPKSENPGSQERKDKAVALVAKKLKKDYGIDITSEYLHY